MEEISVVTAPGHFSEASGSGVAPVARQSVGLLPVHQWGDGNDERSKHTHGETGREASSKNIAASMGQEQQRVLSRKDFWFGVAVFGLLGMNSLMAWNVMLNLAPYMAASYFDGKDWGNTFLACFQGSCALMQIAFIYFKCMPRALILYAASGVNMGAFLALTPAAAYCPRTTAVVLIHLICLTWGAASGALQGTGFAYAGALPVNFAVFVSAGQGIAGLAAFALNTLLGFVFFNLDTYAGLTNQAWVLYVICSALSGLLAVGLFVLGKRPWARLPAQGPAKQVADECPSLVVAKVVPGSRADTVVGNSVPSSDKRYDQTASHAGETNFTKGGGFPQVHKGSGTKWTAPTDAASSKDTSATLLTAGEMSGEQAPGRPQLPPFSHPSNNMSYAHTCGRDYEGGTVDKAAAQDLLADSQPLSHERADVSKELTDAPNAAAELPRRGLLVVVKVMWVPLLCIFATFFVSLNLFPRVGPVGWKYNQKVPNHFVILFGLFAVADTVGRTTPSLQMLSRRWLGWTVIPEHIFLLLTFARVVFYIPFFLSYKLENRVVLNDFWWLSCLMLLFAFTHGWFTSLGFMYAIDKVRESEKGIAGPLAVVSLSAAILIGLYLALAY